MSTSVVRACALAAPPAEIPVDRLGYIDHYGFHTSMLMYALPVVNRPERIASGACWRDQTSSLAGIVLIYVAMNLPFVIRILRGRTGT